MEKAIRQGRLSGTIIKTVLTQCHPKRLAPYLFPLVTRCFLLAALILSGCDHRREHTLTVRTMGTTYNLHVVRRTFGSVAGLQDSVDRRLDEINHGKCASMCPAPGTRRFTLVRG
jgi:hypothetical protein